MLRKKLKTEELPQKMMLSDFVTKYEVLSDYTIMVKRETETKLSFYVFARENVEWEVYISDKERYADFNCRVTFEPEMMDVQEEYDKNDETFPDKVRKNFVKYDINKIFDWWCDVVGYNLFSLYTEVHDDLVEFNFGGWVIFFVKDCEVEMQRVPYKVYDEVYNKYYKLRMTKKMNRNG